MNRQQQRLAKAHVRGSFLWEVREHFPGANLLYAQLDGRQFSKSQATQITRAIANILHTSLELHRLQMSAATNPSLVHHGKARMARWHIVDAGVGHDALADLYNIGQSTATRVAEVIATRLREPVVLLDNKHAPASLREHPGLRVSNPGRRPKVGEIWRGIKGDHCRILSVIGTQVTVLQLDTGHRVSSEMNDFLASYKPPAGARPNPHDHVSLDLVRLGAGWVAAEDDGKAVRSFATHAAARKFQVTLLNDGNYVIEKSGPRFVLRYSGPISNQGRRNARYRGEVDQAAATELELFIDNDADLYRQQRIPILMNLWRKMKRGTYDHTKAVKLWVYLVESGAKKYTKEFDAPGAKWHEVFNIPTREAVARSLADFGKGQLENREFSMTFQKENPSRTKTARAKRSGGLKHRTSSRVWKAAVRAVRRRPFPGNAAQSIHYLHEHQGRKGLRPNPGRETLREWSEKYGIDMRQKGGAFWIPDTFTNRTTRAELWNLSDYLVSSVTGGTIWLVKRPKANPKRRNPGGPRIVYNKLLGGWYVVIGPHQTPLNGRFNSKAEAQAWLSGRRTPNPKRRNVRYVRTLSPLAQRKALAFEAEQTTRVGAGLKKPAVVARARVLLDAYLRGALQGGQTVSLEEVKSVWLTSLIHAAAEVRKGTPNPKGRGISFVKRGDRVRITSGKARGERGIVLVGGGVALVELDKGTNAWVNADRLSPNRMPPRPNRRVMRHKTDARRRANPRPTSGRGSEMARARRTSKMWHEFPASGIRRVKGDPKLKRKTLVGLGELMAVDYRSNKYTGKMETYTHSFKRPRPILATDPDAQHLHIVGGKSKVTADGLVN